MNSNSKDAKAIIILPSDFQEVLITKEIELETGNLDITLIRELLYLYSVIIFLIKR